MKKYIYGYQDSEGKISVWKEHPVKSFDVGCALKILVKIPENLNPYETELGTCIDYNGAPVYLDEALFADENGEPLVSFPDIKDRKDRKVKLDIIDEEGWISTAMKL